ncbi:MAG: hypothetical protein NTY48_00500 [Candidatus Diapherotrites archaeon]|nr:hypothetical protein [Candidatus Diapherotrites archaeon]
MSLKHLKDLYTTIAKSNSGCSITDNADFFKSKNTLLGRWDFVNIWKEKAGDYPILKWQN